MAVRVAIVGFGRVGRYAFGEMLKDPECYVAVIKDTHSTSLLSELLKNDLKDCDLDITCDEQNIYVGEKKIAVINDMDSSLLPLSVIDVTIDCVSGVGRSNVIPHIDIETCKQTVSIPLTNPIFDLPIIDYSPVVHQENNHTKDYKNSSKQLNLKKHTNKNLPSKRRDYCR